MLQHLYSQMARFVGKGSYGRDTFINTFGLLIVASIPLAALPILSRLYSPHDFGLFGVFAAAVGLGTIASTGRYEAAIILPKEDGEAISIALVAFIFLLVFTLLFSIGVAVAYLSAVPLVHDHAVLACLAVIATAFSGCVQVLLNIAIRHRVFLKVNVARIAGSAGTAFLSIITGIYHPDAIGLAAGLTAGYVINSFVLLCLVSKYYQEVDLPSKRTVAAQAKRYRSFPLLSLPSDFSNTLAANLPVMFFSSFFGSTATGYLTMFQRVWAGTSIVANGLGETFRQRAAAERQETGNFRRTMKATLLPLSLVSILLFIIIMGFAPALFEAVIGKEWKEAGVYGQILAPFICLQFIASPISWSFYVSERLKLLSIWQISLLLVLSVAFTLSSVYFGPRGTLVTWSGVASAMYGIYIIFSAKISKEHR